MGNVKYVFSENILYKSGTPGSVVEFDVEGFKVKATCDASGRARVNASAIYEQLFAGEDKIGTDTWNTTKNLSTGDVVKWGYLDLDETDEKWGDLREQYNASSTAGPCKMMVRWLDHYGNWCYWPFERGSHGVSDREVGGMLTDISNGLMLMRGQGRATHDTLTLCVPNAKEELFDFLSDIRRSVHVSVQGENDWLPVSVNTGGSVWVRDEKRAKKQDFEMTVSMNEREVRL